MHLRWGTLFKRSESRSVFLALQACWGEVILPNESIGKGASVRERRESPFLEYVVFVGMERGKRLLSRLKCPFSVPFHPNKGSKFCNWLRETEPGGWYSGPFNLCLELLFFAALEIWLL